MRKHEKKFSCSVHSIQLTEGQSSKLTGVFKLLEQNPRNDSQKFTLEIKFEY